MSLIEEVKSANRITTDDVGIASELESLIDAAKMDLEITGVNALLVENEEDPLIKRAIVLYTKANFGFDNPDAERLQINYQMLRDKLSMDIDYMAVRLDEI